MVQQDLHQFIGIGVGANIMSANESYHLQRPKIKLNGLLIDLNWKPRRHVENLLDTYERWT
jgi:hypothetical protein